MNKLEKSIVVAGCLMMIGVLVLLHLVSAPPQGLSLPGVVAAVNGVPLHEHDVFGPSGVEGALHTTRISALRTRLDSAIELEVLRQHAEGLGLLGSREYQEAMALRGHRVNRQIVDMLASQYEKDNEELKSLRESARATPDEVDAYYMEHKRDHRGVGEEDARHEIERRLSAQKFSNAYRDWVAEEMASVPVSVNGQEIPVDALTGALDLLFPPGADDSLVPRANKLDAFVQAAAGAAAGPGESRRQLMDARMTVGSYTITGGAVLKGPGLINMIMIHALAERARQEGMNLRDQLSDMSGSGRPPRHTEHRVLCQMVWRAHGLVSRERTGEDAAGLRERQRQLIEDLKASADIRIFDRRLAPGGN